MNFVKAYMTFESTSPISATIFSTLGRQWYKEYIRETGEGKTKLRDRVCNRKHIYQPNYQ